MPKVGNTSTERAGVYLCGVRLSKLGLAFREQEVSDFGIDAHGELLVDQEATGCLLALQIKTGASFFERTSENGWWFAFDADHSRYWLSHSLPVLVILCDLEAEIAYWQRIGPDTTLNTGKGYKVEVPRSQRLDQSSRELLENAASRPASPDQYNVLEEEDLSHALARRHSVSVVVLGNPTKAEVAAIVREVVSNQLGSDYYRNPMVESRWEGVDAHVVWVFVYQSPADFKRRIHIARALWVDPDLSPEARPSDTDAGENVGLSIRLVWNENYSAIQDLYKSARISKGAFLRLSDGIVHSAERLVQELAVGLERVDASSFEAFAKSQGPMSQAFEDLYVKATSLGSPSFECSDVHASVQRLAALWQNLTLFMAPEKTWSNSNALAMVRTTIRDFRRDHQRWAFEREKV